jgi:hypothetical protein
MSKEGGNGSERHKGAGQEAATAVKADIGVQTHLFAVSLVLFEALLQCSHVTRRKLLQSVRLQL